MYGCNTGPNEVFAFNRTAGTLCSANLVTRERLCLVARDRIPPNRHRRHRRHLRPCHRRRPRSSGRGLLPGISPAAAGACAGTGLCRTPGSA